MSFKDMGTWAGNGRPCRGQTSPTQELVDAFPMKNGKSIDEAKESGEYNPQDPYKNRDPRLTQTVFYHNSRWLRANVDVSEGGKDNNSIEPTQEATRTKTGYYLKRHLAENEEDTQFGKTNFHSSIVSSWPVVRYADILLMYAEAEVRKTGTVPSVAAINAVNQVRKRAGLSDLPSVTTNTKDAFLNAILIERGHEFFYEGNRKIDLIRFNKYAQEMYKAKGIMPTHQYMPIPNYAVEQAISYGKELKQTWERPGWAEDKSKAQQSIN